MKTVSTMALALALTLGSAAVAKEKPAEGGAPQIKISQKVAPIAQEIQKAAAAKDWATVKAKADQALPLATSADDKFYIGQSYILVGQSTNDQASLSKGIEMELASGKVSADMAPKLAFVQGQIAYQAKDYQKAEASLNAARAAGSNEPMLLPLLVESMRLQGKSVAALQTLNDGIAKQTAAGQQVPTEWFQRGYTIAYSAKAGSPDFAAIRQAGHDIDKKWLASQPTRAAWHDSILLLTDGRTGDSDFMLDTRRLLLAANGLNGPGDYLEYAEAVYLKNPGEAKSVIDTGVKRGVYTIASNRNISEINGIASGRVAADKASLPNSEKTAQTNGKVALAVGDGYYGYGNYAKAVDMYKLAGTKGIDADLVAVRIGTALAASGDAAGAKAAFGQVKAGPRKDLADFWVVHLDHPTQG